jgi:hypothetical protein
MHGASSRFCRGVGIPGIQLRICIAHNQRPNTGQQDGYAQYFQSGLDFFHGSISVIALIPGAARMLRPYFFETGFDIISWKRVDVERSKRDPPCSKNSLPGDVFAD